MWKKQKLPESRENFRAAREGEQMEMKVTEKRKGREKEKGRGKGREGKGREGNGGGEAEERNYVEGGMCFRSLFFSPLSSLYLSLSLSLSLYLFSLLASLGGSTSVSLRALRIQVTREGDGRQGRATAVLLSDWGSTPYFVFCCSYAATRTL